MAKFVKLEATDGSETWLNLDQTATMVARPHETWIFSPGDENPIKVKQTPAQILQAPYVEV